jgi:light-regulated signal transduction histidine kinase (bacteriophytochrome)
MYCGPDVLVERSTCRCTELELRIAELEQANDELSRFAAQAAHDLRAPIQGIAGFADLLARREGARLDEVSQGFLARIFGAVGTMRRLIEATIEHGRASIGEIDAAPVDCSRLVAEAVEGLGPEVDTVGAKIEVMELPTVVADRAQLGRVLHNLIANGVKFSRPGQVPHIVVSGRRVTGGWELSVTDNGAGIAPLDRERIFEPFCRGHRTGGAGDGAGLGLAICKAVVERHAGKIWVEEAPDGGSRFTIFLPDPARA